MVTGKKMSSGTTRNKVAKGSGKGDEAEEFNM
jgi:hypothetical protein